MILARIICTTSDVNFFGYAERGVEHRNPQTRSAYGTGCSITQSTIRPMQSFFVVRQLQQKLDNCNCHGQLPGFTIIDVRFREITNVSISRDL